jgi:arsenite/tail-anchored protein-transporting ATPase
MNIPVPPFLMDEGLHLLAFGGKGGVGKTTCAVASAIYLSKAFPQKKFLVVSTDPAHSLLDSLADMTPPDNLATFELDATRSLSVFMEQHGDKLRQIAARGTFLDDEDINQFVGLSLPGMDELMAFLDILEWVEKGTYDCIIMDTAPTGHTLRLLEMPDLIGKWLDALDALLGKHRYMKQVFKGSYKPDEVDQFLMDLSEAVRRMEVLLQDPLSYRFIPVMLAETLSMSETLMLLHALSNLGMPVKDILINRIYHENGCPICMNGRIKQIDIIIELQGLTKGYSLWGLPLYPKEVRGRESLEIFWHNVFSLDSIEPGNKKNGYPPFPSKVEWLNHTPVPDKKLMMFAGKGGVGKTTMASATAIYISQTIRHKEVLLFSVDPAHSLSACLDTTIGSTPKRIAEGLTAVEIDGKKEFGSLKKQYAEELENFMKALSPNLDLSFDREVMERIMDLSPPGLDEVMALTMAMRFLGSGRYNHLVLDAAPTGHLIRLLELPELIDQWLKAFFNIFLKYKEIFRLPGISKRLVGISKDLKRLRSILTHPESSSLYAVSILTIMAFEETKDLLMACERIGVSTPVILLNMVTPISTCGFCSERYSQERIIKRKFQFKYPNIHQALVYRQTEPRGMKILGELGKELYESSEF